MNLEITMKATIVRIVALSVLLGISGAAMADTTVRVVFMCTVNDGKTLDDVRAANSAWVKFVNANVKSGHISSSILTALVGNLEAGRFIYADDYPSIESWSAAQAATSNSDAGKAIDAALEAAGTCSSNSLYTAEAS
jgi:hypothetical protein